MASTKPSWIAFSVRNSMTSGGATKKAAGERRAAFELLACRPRGLRISISGARLYPGAP